MIPVRILNLLVVTIVLTLVLATPASGQLADSLPPLTPRPSLMAGVADPLISLNGIWLFRVDASTTAPDSVAEKSAGWSPISVPAEWVMQSYAVKPGTFAIYRRTFTVPSDWADKTIKLRFDGVHSVCRVWVNGSQVGEHEGGFTVFEFDVTDRVHPGSNSIAVAVKSESVADTLASASQYAAHQLGGITRKVTLFALPEQYIASLVTKTVFDRGLKNAELVVDLDLASESAQSTAPVTFAFELYNPSGMQELIEPAMAKSGGPSAGKTAHRTFSMKVPHVRKWDPEHPNLYLLRVQLWQDGRPAETLTQHVGFRQVTTRGNRVFVNGQPIKLHGANRHEVHPTLGRSLTPDLWRADAELFRAANVNYIRTSHYPPAEEFLDACDELGLFVECEAALCWVQHGANEKWKEWNYRDDRFLPYLLRANLENVAANRHHPSIIIWSLANESYWSSSFARVLDVVRRVDPSRLTSFHDQCWGQYNNGGSKAQVAVYHYPDENSPKQCNKETRPVLFGEYTHVETYNRREGVTDPGIRDNWGESFEKMYELVYRNTGCLGGAIWAGIDEVFALPEGRVTGYGPWGLFDGWRRPKPEYWHVKKSYSPVKLIDRQRHRTLPSTAVIELSLENRYDFTNLQEVGIAWSLGKEQGNVSVNILPHHSGILRIRPTALPQTGDTLQLTFTDPRGFVCETEAIPIAVKGRNPEAADNSLPPPVLDSTATHYVIRGQQCVYEIDKSTGRISNADAKGKKVLIGGPELMILPLESGECAPTFRPDVPPLNNACTNWQQESIHAVILKNGVVHIISEGTYAEAKGVSRLEFQRDGSLSVGYKFRSLQDVNPRQWGIVLYVSGGVDSLSWQRIGHWNTYPPDHIGRPSGSAVAYPRPREIASASRIPAGAWSADANELGTNDFRSTKSHLVGATLLAPDGHGISVLPYAAEAVRAFVDGERIGLLVAGFNTGGGEPFFEPHYKGERKPLKKGDKIEGSFVLQLVHK
jgi:beta-galactosidase